MSRRQYAYGVWALAGICLVVQLAAVHTHWLNAFFFDLSAADTQGVDFFPLPRAFSNLLDGRSVFDTFRSPYGPYATWFIYHPLFAFLVAPLLFFAPWTAYMLWTFFSAGLMLASALLIIRESDDPLRGALVGLLLLGSFPGFLMLYCGNAQAMIVLSSTLIFVAADRARRQVSFPAMDRVSERMLLAGLLLSLFSKPLVLAMLPLLLLLGETRRVAFRALVIYASLSLVCLAVPGLNPVAMTWPQRAFLLLHPQVVASTMNPYTNGFSITPAMQDNIMHWLVMTGLNNFRFLHVDAYSLPAFLDSLFGTHTPDALYRIPLVLLLAVSGLVSTVASTPERREAALITLMAAALLVLVSYGLIWEYHFTLVLPIAGMLLMRPRLGWFEGSVIGLASLEWLPSLYILLRHQDLGLLGTQNLLHGERVLPIVVLFVLLLFRAIQIALRGIRAEGLLLKGNRRRGKAVSLWNIEQK